jgi:hypothetical protein
MSNLDIKANTEGHWKISEKLSPSLPTVPLHKQTKLERRTVALLIPGEAGLEFPMGAMYFGV